MVSIPVPEFEKNKGGGYEKKLGGAGPWATLSSQREVHKQDLALDATPKPQPNLRGGVIKKFLSTYP